MAALDDFKKFVTDAQSSGSYANWARDNHGPKNDPNYSISTPKPGSELQLWYAARDAIVAGGRPALPTMVSPFGRSLIDAAREHLDATAPVVPPAPVESPDRTVVTGTAGQIVGSDGTVWKLTAGGQILVNGAVDPVTNAVVELAYVTHRVWQNAHSLWWSKAKPSDAWTPAGGTNVNPLTGSAPLKVTISGTPKVGQKLTAAVA